MVSQASKNIQELLERERIRGEQFMADRYRYMTKMYVTPFSDELIDWMEGDINEIICNPEEYDIRKTAVELAYRVKYYLEGK